MRAWLLFTLLLLALPGWAAPVELRVQSGLTLGATHVSFTPDGQTLLSAGGDAQVKFWDVRSGREFRSLDTGHDHGPAALLVSPDGKTLATFGFAQGARGEPFTIQLWDLATGALRKTLTGRPTTLASIAFMPDGASLIAGGSDSSLTMWDVQTGALIKSFSFPGFPAAVKLTPSPDGTLIAAGLSDKRIAVWDVASGRVLRWLSGHDKGVRTLAFSPDGRRLASGSADKTIALWDVTSGERLLSTKVTEYALGVDSLSFSPDGRRLLVEVDKICSVVDAETGRLMHRMEGALSPAFSPDGRLIATGAAAADDSRIRLWSGDDGRLLRSLSGHGRWTLQAKFSARGDAVTLIDDALQAGRWDIRSGKRLELLGANSGALQSHPEIPDHGVMAASADDRIVAYTPENLPMMGSKKAMPADTVVLLYKQGKRSLTPADGHIDQLVFSADGALLAVASESAITLWRVADGRRLQTLRGPPVRGIVFSPDRRTLATSEAGRILLWDVASSAVRATLEDPSAINGLALAFSPDGQRLAAGGQDGLIRLWDTATGQLQQRLRGHSHWVEDVSFSPDGRLLFSASADKTSRLWRVADGAELGRFIDLGETGWVVMTPEGYFNASSFEAADAINVVQGRDVRGVAEFWDVFFRPDLVHRKLIGEDIAQDTRGVSFETAMKSPPPRDVQLSLGSSAPQTQARLRLAFRVQDGGGGIGEVRVFLNGKLLASDGVYKDGVGSGGDAGVVTTSQQRLCRFKDTKACEGEVEFDAIPGELNELSVIAFNAENTIQGMAEKLSFTSELARREPQLWILAVGVNQFSPVQQTFGKLGNAVKDAQDFARAYAAKASGLFKPENIHVTLPGDGAALFLSDAAATRAAILQKLDDIARLARPEDTLVWFVASHGTTNSAGVFGIVPYDIACADPRCADKLQLISSNDILDKSRAIRAMTQLFIFDTCQSGALDAKISGLYDARITTLARNMGLHLYASAQATEHALDSDGRGNGLFTGQLLAGLNAPEADANHDRILSVVELGDYARRQTVSKAGGGSGGESRGASVAGSARREPAALQNPLIVHFGKDAGLARLAQP